MDTVIIVQARMGSTRLPGKVLTPVLGRPLLDYQLERLRRCRGARTILVATTDRPGDDQLAAHCAALGVTVFRGSEDDVLGRYHGAAQAAGAELVVRVTADCPLIDPAVVDQVIRHWREHRDSLDYVSNVLRRTYPRGMDCEVFPTSVLTQAHREATAAADREHVTPYVYRRPERFRLANVAYHRDESRHRWTVDTPEDLTLVERMLAALAPANPAFTLEDCLALIAAHPDWPALNAAVEQKPYGG